MYQRIFRDPGGQEIVRRITNIICPDGSIIMVSPGTVCIIAVNGQLAEALPPGRHTVNPGLSPFFARFMNVMTNGEAPVSVDLYFMTVSRIFLITVPTDEFLFCDQNYRLHLHASAACSIALQIKAPRMFLETLCGFERSFGQDDFYPLLLSLFVPRLREQLSDILATQTITEIQRQTEFIGKNLSVRLKREAEEWGLRLHNVRVLTVSIREEDIAKITALDEKRAGGNMDIELEYNRRMQNLEVELQEIKKLYGDIQTRTAVEAIRNFSNNQGLAALPILFEISSSMLEPLRPYMNRMLRSSAFGNSHAGTETEHNGNVEGNQAEHKASNKGRNIASNLPRVKHKGEKKDEK